MLILSIIGFTGHYGHDDMHYAKLASEWLQGQFEPGDHYSYRWTILAFTAVSYFLFGINDFASALPAFLLMIGILLNVFQILKRFNTLILVIGLSLIVFSQWLLFYSSKLMPDIYVAFAVITALHAVYRFRFKKDSSASLHAFVFVAALLFGFMSEGTIVLIIPMILYVFVRDLILKRHLKFWVFSVIYGVIALTLYFIITFLLTGNAMARFDALESGAYINLCSYADQPFNVLFYRLSAGLIKLFTLEGILLSSLFVFSFLFQRASFDLFRLKTPFSFFFVSTVILFLSSNFMTISFSKYNPMCLDVWHYLFLIPVSAIPASRIIYLFMIKRILGIQLMIAFLVTIIYTFLNSDTQHALIYNFIFLLLIVKYFIPTTFKRPSNFVMAFLVILTLNPLRMVYEASVVKYDRQKSIVKEKVINNFPDAIIVTDDVQRKLSNYFKGFGDKTGPVFVNYDQINMAMEAEQESFLLLNPYTSFHAKEDIPYYGLVLKESSEPVVSDDKTGITLYRFTSIPSLKGIDETFNGFERTVPKWENDTLYSTDIVYNGEKAAHAKEFSPIYRYKFDSTLSNDPPSILIDIKFSSYFKHLSKAQIVVVYEADGKEYHRESRLFDKHIKSIGSWHKVESRIYTPSDKLKAKTGILIYIWNPKRKDFYIDNFEIIISEVDEI